MSDILTKKRQDFATQKKKALELISELREKDWGQLLGDSQTAIPAYLETVYIQINELINQDEIIILDSISNRLKVVQDSADKLEAKQLNNPNEVYHRECITADIYNCRNFLEHYCAIKSSFNEAAREPLGKAVIDVQEELRRFRRLRNIADIGLTEGIYDNAVEKYKLLEDSYRGFFYWAIGILVVLSVFLFGVKNSLVPEYYSDTDFWVFKISVVVVGVTLISYFIKQSTHYQRLADQNYQTQVELQAYPSFMESIPTNEAASVRKELALKYFGRELERGSAKGSNNLVTEQIKASTELVKATTETIKNVRSVSNGG